MKKVIINILVTLIAVPLFGIHSSFGQNSKQNVKPLIFSFLKEVYQTGDDATAIANRYIGLSNMPNEYPSEKRLAIAADHIKMLRKGESLAKGPFENLNKGKLDDLKVVEYQYITKDKTPRFALDNEGSKNVYALVRGNNILKYFLVKDNKILSFDYIEKGKEGQAYFFSY